MVSIVNKIRLVKLIEILKVKGLKSDLRAAGEKARVAGTLMKEAGTKMGAAPAA